MPAGVASNYLHDRVQEGELLQVRVPSGGIGITPMMRMLRWCLENQSGRMLHLYYDVRRGGEHAFNRQEGREGRKRD